MARKILLLSGLAIFLVSGVFILVRAQTSAPSNFLAQPLSACGVKLEWDFTGAANSFELWRDQKGTFFQEPGKPETQVTKINIPLNNPNLTVSNNHYIYKDLNSSFAPGTYYYQVRAVQGGSNSPWSDTNPAIVPALLAPQPASSLDVVSKSNGRQAELTWTIPSAVSTYGGFKIRRGVSPDGNNLAWSYLTLDNNGNTFISSDGSSTTWIYLDGAGTSYSPFITSTKTYSYQVKVFESGEGCGAKTAESALFPLPDGAMIPSAPTNLAASFSYNPNNPNQPIDLSWNQGSKNDHFEIWRKKSDSRGNDADFVKMITTSPAKITQTNYTDADVVANGTYQYEVRACSDAAGKYCSAFSNKVSKTVASAPKNLRASIGSISGSKVTVNLVWENTFDNRNYYLERKTGSGSFTPVPSSNAAVANQPGTVSDVSYNDVSPDLHQTYTWRVYAKFGNVQTGYSNEVTLNLDVTPIKGWAFGFTSPSSSASSNIFARGIGWIRLSNDSTSSAWGDATSTTDSVSYGILMDSSGTISGYAWSGLDCAANENRPAGTACGYGWLSFTSSDLNGCPSGNCEARVNLADGTVSGWAKFTSADNTKGAWDGWVSLRGSKYGLCYGDLKDTPDGVNCQGDGSTNSILSGWAWGSDVGGWINFGTLIPPVLNTVTSASDGKSATLNWSNGMDYSNVEIFISDQNDPDCKSPTSGQCGYVKSGKKLDPSLFGKSVNGFDKNATVDGLNSGTTYGFFIRAYP